MKKVILSALILLCITATGALAQKGDAEQPTETGATSTSAAREGKNVGKGSPMIQRTGSSTGASKATEAPADAGASRSAVAPAAAPATKTAPAPAAAPATKTSPASESAPATKTAPAPASAPAQAPANNTEARPRTEQKSNKARPVQVAPPASSEGQKE